MQKEKKTGVLQTRAMPRQYPPYKNLRGMAARSIFNVEPFGQPLFPVRCRFI